MTLVHGERRIETSAENVSLGGMLLRTGEDIALAEEVVVRFEVPVAGASPVEVRSVVRWHKPGGLGVQFGSLRAREVWALNRWFSTLARTVQQS